MTNFNNKLTGLPNWLSNLSFEKAVRSQLGKFHKILKVTPLIESVGRPNCTILVPISVKVVMLDHTIKKASFILKAQNSNRLQSKVINQFKMFLREQQMYKHILPRFCKIFKKAGKEVQFSPKSYKLDNKPNINYVLMEDLKVKNYKNINRSTGFNMSQIKAVIKKLAEFHAASACYVERYGLFEELFTVGIFRKSNRLILKELNNSEDFLSQLKRWKIGQKYYKKLAEGERCLVDRLMEDQKVKEYEFNVLNHQNCWLNNVLFKYDSFGNIEDVSLIDYQVVKYGSPANDLIFLILSSAHREIKLSQFDYLVKFYFYYLLENLRFLNYRHALPQLDIIQNSLSRNGLAAYCVVSKVLPIIMLEDFEDDNNESYQMKVKRSMFTNRKYILAMNEILPWMDERGLLDWKNQK